jgi:RNA polymerase sigma factor (sigma-70 family)
VTSRDAGDLPQALNAATTLSDAELTRLATGVRIMAQLRLGDKDLAEDVAQETLVRTLAAIAAGRLGDPAHLGAFVRGIAIHVVIDAQRLLNRATNLDLDPEACAVSSLMPDALDMIITEEEAGEVKAALRELSVPDRELLRLLYVEKLSPQQAAAQLGEPAARIRKRKERAMKRLRGIFAKRHPHLSRLRVESD